jgi:peptidoglycan/xylan/chitin deacetylase (PgdA/CDA1 family)
VFLVTDRCGGHNDWEASPPAGRQSLMSWAEAADLGRAGFEIGSHTATHPDLTRLDREGIEEELLRSKRTLEDRLGVAAEWLAYPYGRHDAAVRAIAARHFRGACSTRLGTMGPDSDPTALVRVDAYFLRPRRLFAALLGGRLGPYLAARQTLRDARDAFRSSRNHGTLLP